jgi:flagellar basal-body rod protein FlgF
MDRLIHTALNSLGVLKGMQAVTSQNLANQSVPGFRRDLPGEGASAFLEQMDSLTDRAFALGRDDNAFSDRAGFMDQTGEPMDIAIADRGYFFVRPETGGDPALSRRGDLRVDPDGTLRNGAGDAVLSDTMQPIILPAFRRVIVDDIGRISIEPQEGTAGDRQEVATIATTLATGLRLLKGNDGQIRTATGPLPPPDQGAKVLQGVLEGSNVNPTEDLITSIEVQRSFELNVRMLSTARDLDEAGTRLMRMPEG